MTEASQLGEGCGCEEGGGNDGETHFCCLQMNTTNEGLEIEMALSCVTSTELSKKFLLMFLCMPSAVCFFAECFSFSKEGSFRDHTVPEVSPSVTKSR